MPLLKIFTIKVIYYVKEEIVDYLSYMDMEVRALEIIEANPEIFILKNHKPTSKINILDFKKKTTLNNRIFKNSKDITSIAVNSSN